MVKAVVPDVDVKPEGLTAYNVDMLQPKGSRLRKLDRLRARELTAPEETRIVYADNGKVNKNDQSAIVQQVMDYLIDLFTADWAFVRAIYPSDARFETQRSLVVLAAQSLDTTLATSAIITRVQNDYLYAKVFVDAVCIHHSMALHTLIALHAQGEQRLMLLRGKMKSSTTNLIQSTFGLVQGECEALVNELMMSEDHLYVYPDATTVRYLSFSFRLLTIRLPGSSRWQATI